MTTTVSDTRPGTFTFFTMHWGQLVAGLLLLLVGIASFIVLPGGLIYLILPLPSYIWVGLVPLVVGAVLIVRSLVMAEQVSLAWDGDVLRVEARRLWIVKASIQRDDMRYIDIRHLESKVLRWLAAFVLLLTSYEVHFKNGIDLLGHAEDAPFLLFCFAIVCAALGIFVSSPRCFLEIGTDREARFIPLPTRGRGSREIVDIARFLGFHEDTISRIACKGKMREILESNTFPITTGLAFVSIGVVLVANRSWFLGDFAVPVFILLGAKWLSDAFLGDKGLVPGGVAGEFRDYSGALVAKQLRGGTLRVERTPGITRVHPIEMACYFYLMAQALKYGFRFAFWPYLGFHAAYFLLGLIVLAVIFFKWFGLVDLHVVDFGNFSISFQVARGKDTSMPPRPWIKWYILQRAKMVATSFAVIKASKKLVWAWILFVVFMLVPILYYGLAYPPFIF
nr:hypothetical protein [Candidatus Sigynarchaeum springense]